MPRLVNQAIFNAIKHWQETAGDKALRCNNDNCWDFLEPIIVGDNVVLKCTACKALYESMLEGVLEQITAHFNHKS